jgi:hypothetical protein
MATENADGNPLKNGPATAVAGRIPAQPACDPIGPFQPISRRFALSAEERVVAQDLPLPCKICTSARRYMCCALVREA